jgi:hypothetical protein
MRLSLDTGHLTDEELGVKSDIRRQMCELPISRNERVRTTVTRNGNLITKRR